MNDQDQQRLTRYEQALRKIEEGSYQPASMAKQIAWKALNPTAATKWAETNAAKIREEA